MSDRRSAACAWMAAHPEYKDDVYEILVAENGLSYSDAVNRVWLKVNNFGEDYKSPHIKFRTLIGDMDYTGQGSVTVMWDDRKINLPNDDFFNNFLILRNPDRHK